MHILFLSDNFPPEVNAPASRTFEHAREWVRAGHRVTIITGFPNFPLGKVFAGYRNQWRKSEEIEGITVIRVWTYITANSGFLKRSLDYFSFMITAFLASFKVDRPDVVVGTSPQFFTACAAYLVSRVKRIPFVFELRDLWPASIEAVGAMKHNPVLEALEKLELFLYTKAHSIISVTQAFKTDLVKRGIAPDKIQVVLNGIDPSRFSPRPKDSALVKSLNLEGAFVAGYIGTQGMAHGLDTLLDAALILKHQPSSRPIRLLFLGDGAEKARLKERAESLNLPNVVFLDTVQKEEVARYWSILDVSLIHLKDNPVFETVIPSKIFESMGMGLPIILGVKGEAAEIVEREQAGVVVPPQNAERLATALMDLAQDPDRCAFYAHNAYKGSKHFDRAEMAHLMLDTLLDVVKCRDYHHVQHA